MLLPFNRRKCAAFASQENPCKICQSNKLECILPRCLHSNSLSFSIKILILVRAANSVFTEILPSQSSCMSCLQLGYPQTLGQGFASFFYKGPDKYFRLCGPYSLCHICQPHCCSVDAAIDYT